MIIADKSATARPMLGRGASVGESFVVAAISVAAIYAGGTVLAPLALAVILAFVLTPPIQYLRRRGLPRVVATVAIVISVLLGAAGAGAILTSQVAMLADDLPTYQRTLQDKIKDMRGAGLAGQSMSRAGKALSDLQSELVKAQPEAGAPATTQVGEPPTPRLGTQPSLPNSTADGNVTKPIPVEIHPPATTALEQLKSILGIVVEPLASTGLVILFLLFILLQREDVRDRAIRLLGTAELGRSTAALNESAERLSRFLLAQSIANAMFGVVIGTSLWFIGVPSPILWGIVAALMRFVPFIGSVIAAIFPLILAAAVDPGWSTVLMTLALFAIAEPVMGHVIDPMIQGRATGMTPLAVILSTVFWTMMWGPIGLVLAVPLTLVLVVFGKHIKQLEIFNVLLGDDEPLSPTETFYQRMLSGDGDEAADQAERYEKDHSLAAFFDDVVQPGLHMAARDLETATVDSAHSKRIAGTVETMLDNLEEEDAVDEDGERAESERSVAAVYCVGARTPIDAAAAAVLAFILRRGGIPAEAITENDLVARRPSDATVVISDFTIADSTSRTAYMMRRIRRRLKSPKIVVAHWGEASSDRNAPVPLNASKQETGDQSVVSTFAEAVARVAGPATEAKAELAA